MPLTAMCTPTAAVVIPSQTAGARGRTTRILGAGSPTPPLAPQLVWRQLVAGEQLSADGATCSAATTWSRRCGCAWAGLPCSGIAAWRLGCVPSPLHPHHHHHHHPPGLCRHQWRLAGHVQWPQAVRASRGLDWPTGGATTAAVCQHPPQQVLRHPLHQREPCLRETPQRPRYRLWQWHHLWHWHRLWQWQWQWQVQRRLLLLLPCREGVGGGQEGAAPREYHGAPARRTRRRSRTRHRLQGGDQDSTPAARTPPARCCVAAPPPPGDPSHSASRRAPRERGVTGGSGGSGGSAGCRSGVCGAPQRTRQATRSHGVQGSPPTPRPPPQLPAAQRCSAGAAARACCEASALGTKWRRGRCPPAVHRAGWRASASAGVALSPPARHRRRSPRRAPPCSLQPLAPARGHPQLPQHRHRHRHRHQHRHWHLHLH